MSTKIGAVAPMSDPGSGAFLKPQPGGIGAAAAGKTGQTHDPADLRLVIEPDGKTGAYVYKTLDRRTGEVVNQFPREEVLRLQEDERYRAGRVVDAKA